MNKYTMVFGVHVVMGVAMLIVAGLFALEGTVPGALLWTFLAVAVFGAGIMLYRIGLEKEGRDPDLPLIGGG